MKVEEIIIYKVFRKLKKDDFFSVIFQRNDSLETGLQGQGMLFFYTFVCND